MRAGRFVGNTAQRRSGGSPAATALLTAALLAGALASAAASRTAPAQRRADQKAPAGLQLRSAAPEELRLSRILIPRRLRLIVPFERRRIV